MGLWAFQSVLNHLRRAPKDINLPVTDRGNAPLYVLRLHIVASAGTIGLWYGVAHTCWIASYIGYVIEGRDTPTKYGLFRN